MKNLLSKKFWKYDLWTQSTFMVVNCFTVSSVLWKNYPTLAVIVFYVLWIIANAFLIRPLRQYEIDRIKRQTGLDYLEE